MADVTDSAAGPKHKLDL